MRAPTATLLLVIVLAAMACSGVHAAQEAQEAQEAQPKPFFALAWGLDELSRDRPQIVSPYRNITMFYWLTANNVDDVATAKKLLDQQPEGRRAIIDWNVYRVMHHDKRDQLTTANGEKFTAYWWDHGMVEAEKRYDRFFAAYKRLGGKLDYLILDPEHTPGTDIKTPEHWAAVEKDPRFRVILKGAGARSAEELRAPRPFAYWAYRNYLAGQYYDRLYQVVKKHYPNVKCSDYSGWYNRKHDLVAWGVKDRSKNVPGQYGYHVGTHQALNLYGVVTYLGSTKVDGKPFGLGPYRSLMLAANNMRSAILSSDVPVMPWLAWRGYVSDYVRKDNPPPFSSVGETDYYQENIFHAALCNPDNFLIWSAFRWRKDQDPTHWTQPEDLQLIDDLLDQINELVGYSDRKTLVRKLSPWHAPFLLSGMTANGRSVWRLTPAPEAGPIELSQVKDYPLTFVIGDTRLVMPGGEIYEPEKNLSSAGYWIIGDVTLKPHIGKH